MKRILALALAMLLTAGAVIGVAAYKTDALANKTAVSVRSLYGDPAVADGFTVNYRAAWARRLYWDISVPFGGAAPQTAFTCYKEKAPLEYDFQPSTGLESELDQPGFFADQPANAQKGLSRVLKELYDETPAGEYRTRQVRLRDYYAYYPLLFRISLPDFGAFLGQRVLRYGRLRLRGRRLFFRRHRGRGRPLPQKVLSGDQPRKTIRQRSAHGFRRGARRIRAVLVPVR